MVCRLQQSQSLERPGSMEQSLKIKSNYDDPVIPEACEAEKKSVAQGTRHTGYLCDESVYITERLFIIEYEPRKTGMCVLVVMPAVPWSTVSQILFHGPFASQSL